MRGNSVIELFSAVLADIKHPSKGL